MVAKRWQLLIGCSELIAGIGGLLMMLRIVAYQNVIHATALYYLGVAVVFGVVAAAGVVAFARTSARPEGLPLASGRTDRSAHCRRIHLPVHGRHPAASRVRRGPLSLSPGVNAALWLGPTIGDQAFRLGVNLFPFIALWGLQLRKPIVATSATPEAKANKTARS